MPVYFIIIFFADFEDFPGQPQNVTAVNISSDAVTLIWAEPSDLVGNYLVTYVGPEFAMEGGEMMVNGTEEMVTITELLAGVNYTFTVIAFNEIGASAPSEPLTVRTLEEGEESQIGTVTQSCKNGCVRTASHSHAVPDSPPSNVTATAQSSTSILVTWDMVPPMDQNGVITMYQVLYTPLQTFRGAIGTESMTVTEQMATLTGLQEYVEYNISVRAYTSVGAGPYSDGVVVRTSEDGKIDVPII